MVPLPARILAAAALALSAAACNTTGGPQVGRQSTVAFDRIDGMPQPVFDRYVRKLGDEADAKNVPVVTREGFAPYRIKGYVSLWTQKRQATLSWVWEVFDAEGQRIVRLAGDEKTGKVGRDAWQTVNDEVLARAARSGMEQLAVYFRGPEGATQVAASEAPAPPPAVERPAPTRPVVAGRVASAASLR